MSTGYSAFVQTMITIDFPIPAEDVNKDKPERGNYRAIVRQALTDLFPNVPSSDQRALSRILTNNTQFMVRDAVVADPSVIGGTLVLTVPASDPFDQLNKGRISRALPESERRVSDQQIKWFDQLEAEGRVSTPFNWGLFFNADSRFPELAGLAGAIVGSFYALLVCFLISFPIGIAAAVYLEEFAPKNRWTDLIEVNINNLAAVPSIVFGLLGLAVFLNFFGLPRSAPLVGGMVLALMTLPTIIIVTRASLKAVPPSIREGALGIGASAHQVIFHHTLPLALPGILTGTIIGLAQALGETAPLLLVGMNAFITSPPGGILDASTALPTQVFIWADSPERGFVALTSAGILVLLAFLIIMNSIAIFLRQRLEKTW
jgi:phosphate transport system permease protein